MRFWGSAPKRDKGTQQICGHKNQAKTGPPVGLHAKKAPKALFTRLPGLFIWQREKDSNPHKQSQSLSCYPYTIPLSDLAPARTVFIIAKAQKMSRGIFDFFPDVFQGPDEGTGIFCGAVGSLPITPGQQRPGRRRASAGPFGSYSAPGTWMTPMGHSFTQI